MKVIRILLYVIAGAVGLFIVFLAYSTIDNYKPDLVEPLFSSDQPDILTDSTRLSLLNWNIGYCGLDKSMDFFYDGGENMNPSKEGVTDNLKGVLTTLTPYNSHDFILLQEVDRSSKRSYGFNMKEIIGSHFHSHLSFYGKNYDVSFVPIPLKEPMGKVNSGLLTLTKFKPISVDRFSFPGNYGWPMGVFMLDRCFLVNRYKIGVGPQSVVGSQQSAVDSQQSAVGSQQSAVGSQQSAVGSQQSAVGSQQSAVGGQQSAVGSEQSSEMKELVVINTHNSAYDDGSLRRGQMEYLQGFLLDEYEKGNYVIVGGDWNQTPHGMEPELPNHLFDTINLIYIEKDYPAPDWIWAYDDNTPTNRRVGTPYDKETSLTTVIDCYLLSPNIKLEHVKTIDVGFAYSDHQPVELIVQLQ